MVFIGDFSICFHVFFRCPPGSSPLTVQPSRAFESQQSRSTYVLGSASEASGRPRPPNWGREGARLNNSLCPEDRNLKSDEKTDLIDQLSQMLHVWNIYLQNWVIYGVNVGKYSSTMEHLGMDNYGQFM